MSLPLHSDWQESSALMLRVPGAMASLCKICIIPVLIREHSRTSFCFIPWVKNNFALRVSWIATFFPFEGSTLPLTLALFSRARIAQFSGSW